MPHERKARPAGGESRGTTSGLPRGFRVPAARFGSKRRIGGTPSRASETLRPVAWPSCEPQRQAAAPFGRHGSPQGLDLACHFALGAWRRPRGKGLREWLLGLGVPTTTGIAGAAYRHRTTPAAPGVSPCRSPAASTPARSEVLLDCHTGIVRCTPESGLDGGGPPRTDVPQLGQRRPVMGHARRLRRDRSPP